MNKANIAEIKQNLKYYLDLVTKGITVTITKRNLPIAVITRLSEEPKKNRTKLGIGAGSAKILGDITGPMIPESDWEMLGSAE